MTYNEKFNRTASDFPLGEMSLAEYSLPSSDCECTMFLCPSHAKAKPNFQMAEAVSDSCDLICDECRNGFHAAHREVK